MTPTVHLLTPPRMAAVILLLTAWVLAALLAVLDMWAVAAIFIVAGPVLALLTLVGVL